MYIVFQIRFNRLQWCNCYFASLPHWRPRFDSRGRKYCFVFLLFPFFIYIFCNRSLVAFYIKFNALAKSSHQPLFINCQIQTHYHSNGYIRRYAIMSDILINKVFNIIHSITWCADEHWHLIFIISHFAKFVKPFFKSKFPTYPTQYPC